MFFILSKLLYFILTPIIWFFAVFMWAAFTKNAKKSKRILLLCIVALYIMANSCIVNEAIRAWEIQTVHRDSLPVTYDYAIVLGGFHTYDAQFDRITFNTASDRLWQALLLYKSGQVKKLVISGGEARIITEGYTESETTKDFLIQLGIPADDIIIEAESKNTYENAINTVALFTHEKDKKFLLITSALHMRRARACFAKAGMHCDEFSTDRKSGHTKFIFDYCFIPEFAAIENWRVLIREIAGFTIYKILGYA